jgi:hypothetical protein
LERLKIETPAKVGYGRPVRILEFIFVFDMVLIAVGTTGG